MKINYKQEGRRSCNEKEDAAVADIYSGEEIIVSCTESMNCRNIDKVMEAFVGINLSPVTISKRHDIKYLECIYKYMLGDK